MRRTAAAIALLIVPLLALSGCAPTSPATPTKPKPSSTPLFASEEEALKAATDAYAAYLKVSDEILADGGAHPERLEAVASGQQLKADSSGFAEARESGLRGIGSTSFDHLQLQQYLSDSPAMAIVYLCEDVTHVDVVDTNGTSVVTESRPDRQGYEVTLATSSRSNTLLVSLKSPKESSVCAVD